MSSPKSVSASGRLLCLSCATGQTSFGMSYSFTDQVPLQLDVFQYLMETKTYKTDVYLFPRQPVERVATLNFPALRAALTVFAREHADYMGVIIHLLMTRFSGLCGSTPAQKSELRAHQMARKLRSAGFTPQKIRAELSSNGSCRSRRAHEPMDPGSL